MPLDKNLQYVFRIGSDNQHRLHFEEGAWHYEFLAGGVVFDKQRCATEADVDNALFFHGLTTANFIVDAGGESARYSAEIREKLKQLTDAGIEPCPKHGLMAKNPDDSCEACQNTDYWDDFKGTEGS